MKETKLNSGAVKIVEIDPNDIAFQEPLVMALYGPGGSGKTRFGATAQGRVGLIPLGRKARQTFMNTSKELGKSVIIPEIDFVRTARPMSIINLPSKCGKDLVVPLDGEQPKCCSIHYYRWHVNRVKSAIFRMAEDESCDSIVIDDASILYADIMFANHGRTSQIMPKGPEKETRAVDNKEMTEIIAACGHKNLILVFQSKDEYKNDKRTGAQTWDGFTKLRFEVSILCETFGPQDKETDSDPDYRLIIRQCQSNPGLHGLELSNEDVNFATLASTIYENDPEDWK